MTIEEYASAVLPLIKLSLKEKEKNPSYKRTHIWYLYRQVFYGFSELIDLKGRCLVSVRAYQEFKKSHPKENLENKTWRDQLSFDKSGRQNGKFHLEHVFTGDMFRTAIEKIGEEKITSKNLIDIVEKNYCVAWILKEENKKIPKSKRGQNLDDALAIYKKNDIMLK